MTAPWPAYEVERDWPTLAFLHYASQLPGKLRVRHSPWVNHGWNVTLHPVGNGLATAPTAASGGRSFVVTLDLCDHALTLRLSDGSRDAVPFADGMSVADLHAAFAAMLERHRLPSDFDGRPNEIADALPFRDDRAPNTYSRDSAHVIRDMVAAITPVFDIFRAGFGGKSSPVHFFWGSFDLAVTRFSGRRAPDHPGGIPGLPDRIAREAYSHEVASVGFWPGNAAMAVPPIFYAYAYPEPAGYRAATVAPGRFDESLGEWVLDYESVRTADDPEATLLAFLQSSYDAAADLAAWDRAALERAPVAP